MKGKILLSVLLISIILAALPCGTAVYADPVDYNVGSFEEYCNVLNQAALELKDTVRIKITNFEKKVYADAHLMSKLENSQPKLYYIKAVDYSWNTFGNKNAIMTVKFIYSYPKDKLKVIVKETDAKVDEIVSKIVSTDMPLVEKELAVHDFIAANVKYDREGEKKGVFAEEAYNAYGALVKGTANSIGYAKAMHLLLNRVGVSSLVVYGEGAAWNMVRLDGEYYHVDACADRRELEDGKLVLTHDYYNITDEEMSRVNKWDKALYPKCSSTKANYFVMNKTDAGNYMSYLKLLREGIDAVREVISIKVTDGNLKSYDLGKSLTNIVDDYPDLDYIDFGKTKYYTNDKLGVINVVMSYDHNKEDLVRMKNEVKDKIDKITGSIIKPGMTDYEKEIAIHDYIIMNAKYNKAGYEKNDVPFEEHDAYGVLIKGIGVCDSYAEAFKMLLNKVGIECMTVSGDAKDDKQDDIGHAWSIVKLNGKYYQVDVTWDDREYEDGLNDLCYDYFNLTDEDMAKDHIWDEKAYPECTSSDSSYFIKNDRETTSKQAEALLKSCLKNGDAVVHLKITDYKEGTLDIKALLSKLVNSQGSKAKGVTWTTNDDQGVFKITFEYN